MPRTKTLSSISPIVFYGSDQFSINVLEPLLQAGLRPDLIVTMPDRPAGRKQHLTPPPLKVKADQLDLPTWQPTDLKGDQLTPALNKLQPYQNGLFIVASYGLIIPKVIVNLPRYKTLNIHPSLLPRWRGPSPIQNTILYDEQAGVSLMQMDEYMDHGPVLDQRELKTKPWPPDYYTLEKQLAAIGAEMLIATLPAWLDGRITPQPQDHSQATYSTLIKKSDAELDLNADPAFNFRKIQAYKKWPRAFFRACTDNDSEFRVVVTSARLEHTKLIFERVIPAGRNEMNWQEFRQRFPNVQLSK